MTTLTIEDGRLLRGGRPHRVLSGALHYFRIHPDQWERQLRMLQAMGLNTVETYVAWNLHERTEGEFDFEGFADVEAFIRLAGTLGLDVIVRPGPYICAEWDNGGLPAWITARVGNRVRTSDPEYLAAVDRWLDELIPRIAALQSTVAGPVHMVQIENEYGSYGSDSAYLAHMRDALVARGIDVLLFTSDGPEETMLSGGTLPGVWPTLNFGSHATRAFALLDRVNPGWPHMCMEFWCGWFDHWGESHSVRSPADAAEALREVLDSGASVNVYMAQGGTNFGPWAGANRGGELHDGALEATITSYDYDAPLDERGEPTEKFHLFREEFARIRAHDGDARPLPDIPPAAPWLPESVIDLEPASGPAWPAAIATAQIPSLDTLGIDQGVAVHRAHVRGPRPALSLHVPSFGDRLDVYVDGALIAGGEGSALDVELPAIPLEGREVTLVVESHGRVNYGPRLGEPKGITGPVLHGGQIVHGWESSALRLDDLDARDGTRAATPIAPAWHGTFPLDAAGDTRLAVEGPDAGVVWINGFCLGRFDGRGPQVSLHLPSPLLHAGANEVIVVASVGSRHPHTAPVRVRLQPGTGF